MPDRERLHPMVEIRDRLLAQAQEPEEEVLVKEFDITITLERDGVRKHLYSWAEGISKEQVAWTERADYLDMFGSDGEMQVRIEVTP